MLIRLKFRAKINGGYASPYIVQDEDIVNWDDIKRTVKRKDYGGVTRTFTDTFEFCGGMYTRLLGRVRDDGRNAGGLIIVEAINDDWTWSEVFSCELDFSTIKVSGTTISIGCMDRSLTSLLNANKSTKYDLGGVMEPNRLYYDRVIRYPGASYVHEYNGSVSTSHTYQSIGKVRCVNSASQPYADIAFVPMQVNSQLYDERITMHSVGFGAVNAAALDKNGEGVVSSANITPFVVAKKFCVVRVKINTRIETTGGLPVEYYNQNSDPRLVVLRATPDRDNSNYYVLSVPDSIPGRELKNGLFNTVKIDADVDLGPGEGLVLAVLTPAYRSNGSGGSRVGTESSFGIWCALPENDYSYRDGGFEMRVEIGDAENLFYDPFECNVIKPERLLTALASKIAGYDVSCKIETQAGSVLANTLIVPTDYLRGIRNARVSASYKDFCDWMLSVFGYVPSIDDSAKTVTFRHRDDFFGSTVVKEIDNLSRDVEMSYNKDFDYASVEVGYAKKDYEKKFGRDEWRWLTRYSTGQSSNDKKLQLVSPWRADVYGMEYVSAERRTSGSETVDDKSDNDMFFVCAELDSTDGLYHFVRQGWSVSGIEENADTMFNVMYSPCYMLRANEHYLACITSKLIYASCDGNASAVVARGTVRSAVSDDVTLSNPLFGITCLSLTTDTYDEVEDWTGLASVTFANYIFTGYVSEVEQTLGRESSTKYKLTVKTMTQCS